MLKTILPAIVISLLLYFSVSAQEPNTSADTVNVDIINLNEIVVRSTRESSLIIKNMATSVSMLKSKTIEDIGVSSLKDLMGYIPNFFMPDYGSRLTSPVYIRGIGSRINSPSVGLYVDNVPYFEKAAFDFELSDIERIEVLRGPQGTSYGRNTMGGLINVYTRNPSELRETKVEVSGGNYGFIQTDLSHSQPLSGKTGISVSGFYGRHAGFFVNDFDQTQVDDQDYLGSRLKLNHKQSELLNFQFSSTYQHSNQGGYPYAVIDPETNGVSPVNYDYYSSYIRDMLSSSLVVDYTPQNLILQSATSFQFLKGNQDIDQDFTEKSLFFVNQKSDQKMFSQEFTVKNKPGKKITWVTGAFGFLQIMDDNVNVDYGPDGIILYNLPGASSRIKNYDNLVRGGAIFHESNLNNLFVHGITLSAGIRLDYEKATQDYLYNTISEGVVSTVDDSRGELSFIEVLPKVSLSYNMGRHITAYSTIARGYKTGGFNTTFERDEDRTFKPEYSWNYEAGFKSILFDKALLANFSVFYIDWKDQQIYQPVPSGQGAMLKNAGQSLSKGIEVELVLRPGKNTMFYTSYGFTDAKFIEYQRTEEINYKGNFIPYAPGNTLQIGADLTVDVNKPVLDKIIFYANYQGQGKIFWNEENSAFQNFYGLVNGRISFVRKSVRLDFWAKNILNQSYNAFYFTSLGNSFVQPGKPLQIIANLVVTL